MNRSGFTVQRSKILVISNGLDPLRDITQRIEQTFQLFTTKEDFDDLSYSVPHRFFTDGCYFSTLYHEGLVELMLRMQAVIVCQDDMVEEDERRSMIHYIEKDNLISFLRNILTGWVDRTGGESYWDRSAHKPIVDGEVPHYNVNCFTIMGYEVGRELGLRFGYVIDREGSEFETLSHINRDRLHYRFVISGLPSVDRFASTVLPDAISDMSDLDDYNGKIFSGLELFSVRFGIWGQVVHRKPYPTSPAIPLLKVTEEHRDVPNQYKFFLCNCPACQTYYWVGGLQLVMDNIRNGIIVPPVSVRYRKQIEKRGKVTLTSNMYLMYVEYMAIIKLFDMISMFLYVNNSHGLANFFLINGVFDIVEDSNYVLIDYDEDVMWYLRRYQYVYQIVSNDNVNDTGLIEVTLIYFKKYKLVTYTRDIRFSFDNANWNITPLENKYINYKNMLDVSDDDHLHFAWLSLSNEMNVETFTEFFKNKRFCALMISNEVIRRNGRSYIGEAAFRRGSDGVMRYFIDTVVGERSYSDFGVWNSELADYYVMPLYVFMAYVDIGNYNIDFRRPILEEFIVVFDGIDFDGLYLQLPLTSAPILSRAWSVWLRRTLWEYDQVLYEARSNYYLKSSRYQGWDGYVTRLAKRILLVNHKTEEVEFQDPSGHIVNACGFSTLSVYSWRLGYEQVRYNVERSKGRPPTKMERETLHKNLESKGIVERIEFLWHSKSEVLDAFDIYEYLRKMYSLYKMGGYKKLKKIFGRLNFGKAKTTLADRAMESYPLITYENYENYLL